MTRDDRYALGAAVLVVILLAWSLIVYIGMRPEARALVPLS